MNGTVEITAVLLGFFVRLGIPIVATLLLGWGLRKLDTRWRRQAAEERILALSAQGALVRQPCWQMNNCTPERMAQCLAYQETGIPCWEVFREKGELRKTCVDCNVLKRALTTSSAQL